MPFDSPGRTLLVVGLGVARTLPLVMSVPAFGGPNLPVQIRIGIAVGLAGFCFSLLSAQLPHGDSCLCLLIAAREVIVGTVMGFVVACMFRAAEISGQLTDILRGASMAEVLSPAGARSSSPLGVMSLLLAVVVFYRIGGVGMVVAALVQSYQAIPLAEAARCEGCASTMVVLVILAATKLIASAVGLCAPALVSLLLADVILGAIGRATRQLPLYFIGMPFKALLGIGAVLVSVGTLDLAIQTGFQAFFGLLATVSPPGR